MFLENQSRKDCCGCSACSKICGASAITMKQDKCGFYYPRLNKEKCKDCGLCQKVCPMQENYVGQEANPEIYAVRNPDKNILMESSSGGMFTVLARWTLSQNGVIYGVAFDESFSVRHMRAETEETARKFRTSKYVDSDISEVYSHIIDDLKSGRTVLLTGTPCQISGVCKYLKLRRVNTENLYTCDNICHGVPSRKIWEHYLHILKSRYIAADDEITHINMRSKKVYWREQILDIQLKKGSVDSVVQTFSFNKFFLSLYGNRPSCFHCRYTSYKRPGDFSLGDFWTSEKANLPFDIESGVNVVLVNTPKGQKLFHSLKEQFDSKPVSKQECWQPHLEYSAKPPKNQQKFWKEYLAAADKEPVLRKYMKGSMITRIIRTLSPFLRKTGLYNFAGKMYKIIIVKKSH